MIDALAQFIPDTLTISQQITSRLIEPLMQGQVPINLYIPVYVDSISLLELVTITTEDLAFNWTDQTENDRTDDD